MTILPALAGVFIASVSLILIAMHTREKKRDVWVMMGWCLIIVIMCFINLLATKKGVYEWMATIVF